MVGDDARRAAVLAGRTVVAHVRADVALIAWAQAMGKYTYCGRPGFWGNPYVMAQHGDRSTVIARHATWLAGQPQRLAKIGTLRGHVLGCWCYPQACHCDTLAALADGTQPDDGP
jgi:hypothetical protein